MGGVRFAVHAVLACSFVLCFQLGTLAQETADYKPIEKCKNFQVCAYKYTAHQSHFDEEEKQDEDFSADVELLCQSDGEYDSQAATLYCIKVENVEIDSDVLKNDSSNSTADGSEERIDELQEFINSTVEDPGDGTSRLSPWVNLNDMLFAKDFCFVQTDDGQIVDVMYPSGENIQVVNIKKSIASAFQANFKYELAREEADVSGVHRASYKYRKSASGAFYYTRTVNSSDLFYVAGVPKDMKLTDFDKEDTASFDSKRTLQRAQGRMHVSLASLSPSGKKPSGATRPDPDDETFDDSLNLDQVISATGYYTLTKITCRALWSTDDGLVSRVSRSVELGDISGMARDSILAKVDEVAIARSRMARLRRALPSVPAELVELHKDPKQYKRANKLHDLLSLEARHGPLPGHSPVIGQILAYMKKIRNKGGERDVAMRQLLYSMLVTDGDQRAQKILVDIFTQLRNAADGSPELDSLTTYMAFLRNATMNTVNRLLSLLKTNNDSLLLTLGSLAEFAPKEVQEKVVAMLSARLRESDDTFTVAHLLHSLGNTGSEFAVDVLLDYLQAKDLEVQVAAISSLRMHISSETVQIALTELLEINKTEEIVEAVVQMLLSAIREHSLHPEEETDSSPLNSALVMAALQSDNSKLHSMVILYLKYVATEHSKQLISVMEEAESDPSLDEMEYNIDGKSGNGSEALRLRRGSDWDAWNSDYNAVASYYSRRSDVGTYPQHRAYIYGKRFGVSKVYAQFAAGGFAGGANNGQKYKIFAKAVANGHAFGRTATAAHAEYLRRRSYSSVYQKIYVKIVGKVLKNEAGYVPLACYRRTINLYQTSRITLLDFRASVFIYVGTLDFTARLYAKLTVDVNFCACEREYTTCATLTPTVTLEPSAGASATLLGAVRGGVDVTGKFQYKIEPEVCLRVDFQPWVRVTPCLSVYHSWPNSYVEIYAYYQTRAFKAKWPPWKSYFYWTSKRKWNALSTRWDLSSTGRRRLWSSCSRSVQC